MKSVYINLDGAKDRRAALEANFRAFSPAGWSLQRVPAIDAAHLTDPPPGGRSLAEKACFLSHVDALEQSLADPGPVLILEDDTMFCEGSFAAIEAAVAALGDQPWDVIWTDMGVTSISNMAQLLKLRQQIRHGRPVLSFDARRMPFFGANAYLVNGASKAKLHALLRDPAPIDTAYDHFLKDQADLGRLAGHVIFPFATTVSLLADASAVQPSTHNRLETLRNLYRRRLWIGGPAPGDQAILEAMTGDLDEDARAIGLIWAALAEAYYKI